MPVNIEINSKDIVWIGSELYCKTPEGLETALTVLGQTGYTIKDNRLSSRVENGETTVARMEQQGASLWFAHLEDIHRGKCGSCHSLISVHGIQSHGHTCENCGEVTYLDLIEDSTIRFRFRADDRQIFGPELNMKVIKWDSEQGWLYLQPQPLNYGGLCVVDGEKAQQYLSEHNDKWELVQLNGTEAIKVHYAHSLHARDDDVIEVWDRSGHYFNFRIVKIWDGEEYGEYDPDFPLPSSINIYEAWHWAPLEPSPTLHERIIGAVGQVSSADYYGFDGRAAWSSDVYRRMGLFVRHFTSLNADVWDRVSTRFPLDGPGGIEAVAKFCHPDAVVRNEPNIGNLLSVASDVASGRRIPNIKELAAAQHALEDPESQGFARDLFQFLIRK